MDRAADKTFNIQLRRLQVLGASQRLVPLSAFNAQRSALNGGGEAGKWGGGG